MILNRQLKVLVIAAVLSISVVSIGWAAANKNLAVSATATAGQRIALVIGNRTYERGALNNPTNDARDMKAVLEQLGFSVVYRENADLTMMDNAVREFIRQLSPSSVGLVYYSGHGVQADGSNYLLPINNANINSKSELKARAYDAGIILGEMQEVGNRVNIVILDACRDNPFKGFKGGGDGLGTMSGPKGSLIAFATAPNTVASDNPNGRNGLYTKYLKQYIATPGLTAEEMFKKVRQAVVAENDSQVPWENSSIIGDFCFAGCESSTETARQTATEVERPPVELPPRVTTIPSNPEEYRDAKTGMVFKAIPAGCFQMGSPKGEGDSDEHPQHRVCLKSFQMGQHEVTQGQWKAVMGSNPSSFKECGDNCPVEQVSWDDIQLFLKKLNQQTGKRYRLPSEAEWEYAARGGTTTARYWGDSPDSACLYANVADKNSRDGLSWNKKHNCDDGVNRGTAAVGSYRPNDYGLYDMLGNVWEWTCSEYEENYSGGEKICKNRTDLSGRRVVRGGAWNGRPDYLRSATRGEDSSDFRNDRIGFRLLLQD